MTVAEIETELDQLLSDHGVLRSAAYSSVMTCQIFAVISILRQMKKNGEEFEALGTINPPTAPDYFKEYSKGECDCFYKINLANIRSDINSPSTRIGIAYDAQSSNLLSFYTVEEYNVSSQTYNGEFYRFLLPNVKVSSFPNLFTINPATPLPNSTYLIDFDNYLLFMPNIGHRSLNIFDKCECYSKIEKFLTVFRAKMLQFRAATGYWPDTLANTINIYTHFNFFDQLGLGDWWRSLCYCDYHPHYQTSENEATLILFARGAGKRNFVVNFTRVDGSSPFQSGIYMSAIDNWLLDPTTIPSEIYTFLPMAPGNPFPLATETYNPIPPLIINHPQECIENPARNMAPAFELLECEDLPQLQCFDQIEDVWQFEVGDNIRLFLPYNKNVVFWPAAEEEFYQIKLCDAQTGQQFDLTPRDEFHQPFSLVLDTVGNILVIYVDFVITEDLEGRCLRFCFVHEEFDNVVDACSTPFVVTKQCDTMLIRFRCEHNCLGYPYKLLTDWHNNYWMGNYQQLRVRLTINKSQHDSETIVNKTSRGVNNILFSKLTETFELESDYYTEEKLKFLTNAIHHDYFEAYDDIKKQWVRYICESSQTNVWVNSRPQYPYAKLQAKLTRYKDFRENTYC